MIKDKILDFLSSNNRTRACMALEGIFLNILEKKIKEQGKEFIIINNGGLILKYYDCIAPDGFDSYEKKTAIMIKFYKTLKNFPIILNKMISDLRNNDLVENVIIICTMEFNKQQKETVKARFNQIGIEVDIWGFNEIESLIQPYEDYFNNAIDNASEIVLNKQIKESIKHNEDDWKKYRERHIEKLKEAYENDDIVLFLGAGTSFDAKIPTWDNLISDMFVSFMGNKLVKNDIKITDKEKEDILNEMLNINNSSPLLQARFIRSGLGKEFTNVLSEVLYKDCTDKSILIDELSKLCFPLRNGTGIHAVINYNFDDLLEKNLSKYEIKHRAIYQEADIPNKNELGIYHVHGFLPREKDKYDKIEDNLLVFSEEGYHSLYLDPYNWSNLVQLNFLKEKTGLFIGLSMTDPNLRRILDIACSKKADNESCNHYAILKRNVFKTNKNKNIGAFERVTMRMQENYFKEIGVNVIWVDDYKEIPNILKRVRK